jgi:hypothetical protein
MNHKELYGVSIRDGFNKFIAENPHIYKSFEEQTLRAIKKGRTKISSDLIINYIRWEQFIESSDKHFKINNSYSAYIARHFIKQNPEYSHLFNLRKLRNEEDGQYMSIDKNGEISFF